MTRKSDALAKRRKDVATQHVFSLPPEQRAEITPERLTASFGVPHADAERILLGFRGR